jgi:hypothetical protein
MSTGQVNHIAIEIAQLAQQVCNLAQSPIVDIDQLRGETAGLQAMIAEAARLRRLEQRYEVRGAAVLTPIVIETEDFAGFCLVSNFSPHGISGKVPGGLTADQPIRMHISSDEIVDGSVVWSDGDQIGVKFHNSMDLTRALAGQSLRGPTGKGRPARLPVQGCTELFIGSRILTADILDLSQRGLKVATSPMKAGQELCVQLESLAERTAVVRWSRGKSAGLSFSRPLSFRELAHLGQSLSSRG